MVRTGASLVSLGTERYMLEFARKSLLEKAKSRPDLVKQVITKAQAEGPLEAYRQAMGRLDAPVPLGYSAAGVVIAVGEKVTGFAVGDRVACAGSGYASHAEIIRIPKNLVVKIPEAKGRPPIPFEEAAFVALGGIAIHAVRLANLSFGERVVVLGLGLLGQLAVQILRAAGCQVMGLDVVPEKVQMALEHGAHAGAVFGRDNVLNVVRAFSDGYGADAVLIFAATESNEPIELAAEIARERGRVVVPGLVGLNIPRKIFYEKELELVVSRAWGPGMYDPEYEAGEVDYPFAFVRWTAQRNMAQFLDMLADGRISVAHLITHRFPIDRALEAYQMLLEGKEPAIGVILTYGQPEAQAMQGTQISFNKKVLLSAPRTLSPSGTISIGLIGAGQFAGGTLLPAMRGIRGLRFRGLATSTGLTAHHTARKSGFEYFTIDYREILTDPEIDLVFILTRHNSHARFVTEALQAGKHVFVEKPLALNMEQLQEVIAAYSSRPLLLMVGFNRRFSPFTRWLKERFAGVPEPLAVHCTVNAGSVPPNHWVHDPEQGGGRIIGEVCHFIDLIQYLTGSVPVRAYAETLEASGYQPSDNVVITLKMANGAIGSITYVAGGDKRYPRERVEVFGGGAVGVIENFQAATFIQGGRKRSIRNWLSVDRGYRGEIEALIEAIRNGGPAPADFEEYIYTTLATFAIEKSLKYGHPITVEPKRC
ncbi:MAG: bi-domain-containing oxidoreductase [Candidatus Methanomethylicaceae archaeon]